MTAGPCVNCDREARAKLEGGCCDIEMAPDGHPARCVREWSDDKHFYFRRYCSIFSSGMKNHWPNRVFVDLFAGPGMCRIRPQGTFTIGSPLIALEGPFTHYLLSDLSSHCTATLQARLHARSDETRGRTLEVFTEDCNTVVDALHRRIAQLGSQTLAFAFIDPPGIEVHFDTLRRLTDGARVDLLINFPLGMNIKRQLVYRLDDEGEGALDRYFGTRRWREMLDTGVPNGVALLGLYKDQLRSLGYGFIGEPKAVRGTAPLYDLVFASKSARGAEFWEKINAIGPGGQRRLL